MSTALFESSSEMTSAQRLVDSLRARRIHLHSDRVREKVLNNARTGAPILPNQSMQLWGMNEVTISALVGGLAGVVVCLTAFSTVFAGRM